VGSIFLYSVLAGLLAGALSALATGVGGGNVVKGFIYAGVLGAIVSFIGLLEIQPTFSYFFDGGWGMEVFIIVIVGGGIGLFKAKDNTSAGMVGFIALIVAILVWAFPIPWMATSIRGWDAKNKMVNVLLPIDKLLQQWSAWGEKMPEPLVTGEDLKERFVGRDLGIWLHKLYIWQLEMAKLNNRPVLHIHVNSAEEAAKVVDKVNRQPKPKPAALPEPAFFEADAPSAVSPTRTEKVKAAAKKHVKKQANLFVDGLKHDVIGVSRKGQKH
jgi:hypothetical protein